MVLSLAGVLFVEDPGLHFVILSFSTAVHDTERFLRCIGQVMSESAKIIVPL